MQANSTTNSATASGNGLVANSLILTKSSLSASSIAKSCSSDNDPKKSEVPITSIQSSLNKNTASTDSLYPNEKPNTKCSVKEKIMLFTKNNFPLMVPNNLLSLTSSTSKPPSKMIINSPKIEAKFLHRPTPINSNTDNLNNNQPKQAPSSNYLQNSVNKNLKSNQNFITSINPVKNINQTTIQLALLDSEGENLDPQNEVENVSNFKSIKEKIAYFSSKLNNQQLKQDVSSPILTKKPIVSNKNILANKIEIISSSLAQDLAFKQMQIQKSLEDYDSLKHAYKLNALNSTFVQNKIEKS